MVPSMILQWGKLKKRWGQRRNPLKKRRGQRRNPLTILVRPFVTHKENAKVKKEKIKFDRMLEDHKKLLYPTCDAGHKKLGTTLELLQWKAKNGVSDKGFAELLKIQKKMLPKDNELPSTTYESKTGSLPFRIRNPEDTCMP